MRLTDGSRRVKCISTSVKCARNECLGVRDDGMSPVQDIVFGLAWSDGCLVLETMFAQTVVHLETVGANRAARRDGDLGECLHRPGVKPLDRLYLHETRPACFSKSRCHNGFHAPCAAPSPAWIGSSKVSFIHLHDATQTISSIPIGHGRPNPVQHQPRSDIGYSKFLAQLQCRVTSLVACDEEERPEPLAQGRPALVKQRTGSQ